MKELRIEELLNVLDEIQSMCIGEIAMGYKLDAVCIGNLISTVTGLTQPELADHCKDMDVPEVIPGTLDALAKITITKD